MGFDLSFASVPPDRCYLHVHCRYDATCCSCAPLVRRRYTAKPAAPVCPSSAVTIRPAPLRACCALVCRRCDPTRCSCAPLVRRHYTAKPAAPVCPSSTVTMRHYRPVPPLFVCCCGLCALVRCRCDPTCYAHVALVRCLTCCAHVALVRRPTCCAHVAPSAVPLDLTDLRPPQLSFSVATPHDLLLVICQAWTPAILTDL